MNLTVLLPPREHPRETKGLETVLHLALADIPHRIISHISEVALPTALLLAVSLGVDGMTSSLNEFLSKLREEPKFMRGSVAGIVLESQQDQFGKDYASQLAEGLNGAGCALVPRPLVEATGSLSHFSTEELRRPLEENPFSGYIRAITALAQRIVGSGFRGKSPLTGQAEAPKLLAVHVCLEMEPNLSDLWEEISHRLRPFISMEEISLRKQTIHACHQCNIHRCDHFQPQANCFYGSALSEDALLHLAETDALLLVCQNYHNGLHPQLTAFLQQISALMSPKLFPTKALYAVVVSPYSGGDMVVKQILTTLSLDGSFYVPPKFSMLETASQPMEALGLSGIETRLDEFSHEILKTLSLGHLV